MSTDSLYEIQSFPDLLLNTHKESINVYYK